MTADIDARFQDVAALLTSFDGSSWGAMHVRSRGLEIYAARDGVNDVNPMLFRPIPAASENAVAVGMPPVVVSAYELRAPHLGTSRPGVRVGDRVDAETIVVDLELLGERRGLRAGRAGKVAAVLAGDGDLVEFDQILLTLEESPAKR